MFEQNLLLPANLDICKCSVGELVDLEIDLEDLTANHFKNYSEIWDFFGCADWEEIGLFISPNQEHEYSDKINFADSNLRKEFYPYYREYVAKVFANTRYRAHNALRCEDKENAFELLVTLRGKELTLARAFFGLDFNFKTLCGVVFYVN